MLAEKASDILLKRPALQPEALPFHSQVSPSLARTSA
jgi:hypothetical protein